MTGKQNKKKLPFCIQGMSHFWTSVQIWEQQEPIAIKEDVTVTPLKNSVPLTHPKAI